MTMALLSASPFFMDVPTAKFRNEAADPMVIDVFDPKYPAFVMGSSAPVRKSPIKKRRSPPKNPSPDPEPERKRIRIE